MIIQSVLENINRGREGCNKGLYTGFPKLTEYLPGVQTESTYVIGGMTGSAKTAFTLSTFLYNPYEDYMVRKALGEDISLRIPLWSAEMSKEIVMTKGVARKIFKDYGILTDINLLLSRGKNRISQEIYDLVIKTVKYFEEMEDVVTIYGSSNPTGINRAVRDLIKQQGKIEEVDKQIVENGQQKTIKSFVSYKPHAKVSYIIPIVDHLSIMKIEDHHTVKQNIDRLCEYMIENVTKFKVSPVLVQQLNRAIDQVDRQKANMIEVQLSDFKDSSDPVNMAHYVLGLNNPYHWEMSTYRGYDISKLQNRFRSVKLCKTRDGVADIIVGLAFIGECGMFRELSRSKEMTEKQYQEILQIKKYHGT